MPTSHVESTDMTTAQDYRAISVDLFEQANIELEAGDLIQASEKFWGATAQALKAIAQERGWEHNSHAHFYRIVQALIEETGDEDLFDLFGSANLLHINFYEHWMNAAQIRKLADQVGQLINRLDHIQNS